ncbi:MAG: 3-methyladenine glycosylase [Marmoricola sp.]|jgi:DNA-3-methyladenine glycosylase I|nr:3-methyladenine glycosylase [Marmoricola sp.]
MTGAVTGEDGVARCPWASRPGTMQDYHDTEWGVPVDGERGIFERLSLEGFQAGLSWSTILNKRDRFREVFHGFDVDRVAAMTDADLDELMGDTGIVRNRAKILATRKNALATIALRSDEGLEAFIAGFRPGRDPEPRDASEVPAISPESTALSKALRKRGFGFVGPTTVHALMEATGLVDTHLVGCHRRGIAR